MVQLLGRKQEQDFWNEASPTERRSVIVMADILSATYPVMDD